MASKKVFTSLEFQSGAKLIAPKVELRTPAATLTDPEDNAYYTGSAGQLAYGGDTNLYVHNGTGWKALHHAGSAFSTDKVITSTKDDGAPFVVADSTRVDNLKAELLGSSDDTLASGTHRISTTAAEHGIPVYGTGGVLKVSDPLSLDDAANRRYVDSAVQGLDHKESVRSATTANITIATALNDADTLDGVTLATNDRVLVKNQTTASENGIYIVGASPARATDAAEGPNLLGDDGDFNDATDLVAWNHNSIGTQSLDTNRLKLTNAASGSDMRARTYSIAYATEVGKTYKFSYANTAGTANGFCHLGTASGGSDIKANVSEAAGTHTFTWQATSAVAYIHFGVASASANIHTSFDDVSIVQVELTDGAFVFVEEGTAQVNSSWVLNGTAWTQFSGAGQLTVNSNGSVAAPLTKSGDTIDFRYSLDNALSTTSAVSLNSSTLVANSAYGMTSTSGASSTGITASSDGSSLDAINTTDSLVFVAGKKYRAEFTGTITSGTAPTFSIVDTVAWNVTKTGFGTLVLASGSNSKEWVCDESGTFAAVWYLASTAGAFVVADFKIVEVDALTVKSGGIDTVHLADDAVTAAKLADSATFAMAGLTIGTNAGGFTAEGLVDVRAKMSGVDWGGDWGEVWDAASQPGSKFNDCVFHLDTDRTGGTTGGIVGLAFSPGWQGHQNWGIYSTNESGGSYTQGDLRFVNQLNHPAGSYNERVTFKADGKVGIGTGATSPSGTLHVSTARYGPELIGNGTAWTGATGTTKPNSWTLGNDGTYTIDSSSGSGSEPALKITSTANNSYIWQTCAVTTGRKYYVSFRVKNVDATSVNVALGSSAIGEQYGRTDHTSTSWTTYTFTKTATTDIFSIYVQVVSSPNVRHGYIDSVSIREDSLAAGVNSNGDDLVVNNNGNTGISVISRAVTEASLYLGDGLDDDFSRIYSKRAIDGTGDLKFLVNGSDALEIDSSQNVKIPNGGLGIGATVSGRKLTIKEPTAGAVDIFDILADDGGNLFRVGKDDTDNCYLEMFDGSNVSVMDIRLNTAGTSYFNGGNVAIGATSADSLLHIHKASAGTIAASGDAQLVVENSGIAAINILSGNASHGQVLFGDDGDADDGVFGYDQADQTFYWKTAGVNTKVLKVESDGTQDHGANSIVNSSTVQGLQDGACYDFDGTDDKISFPLSLPTVNFTVASWVKFDSADSSTVYWFDNRDDYNTNENHNAWLVYTEYSGGKRLLVVYAGAAKITTDYIVERGVWTHLCLVKYGSTITLYIDGVQIGTASSIANPTNGANFYIGTRYTGDSWFKGQIRDTKILSSQLDAGGVRKLYSGENPEKNLDDVPVKVNDSARTDSTAGWTKDTYGTLTFDTDHYELANTAALHGIASTGLSFTTGREYLVRYAVKNGTAPNGTTVRVMLHSGGWTGQYDVTTTNLWVTHSTIITATSTVTNGQIAFLPTADLDGDNIEIRDIVCAEAGTIVDFNPRSASSTKWYNAAWPSLYNGTLQGGVTLSAGNSYWNNIKQVGSDVEIAGELIDLVSETSLRPILKLENTNADNHNPQLHFVKNSSSPADDDHLGQIDWKGKSDSGATSIIPYSRIQADSTDVSATSEHSNLRMYTRASGVFTETLTLTSANTKVHNKLGVGGDPSTADEPLLINGTGGDATPLLKLTGSASDGFNWISSAVHTNLAVDEVSAHFFGKEQADKNLGWIGFKYKGDHSVNNLVTIGFHSANHLFNVAASGNCGIGTETPKALLDISSSSTGDYPLIIRSDIDGVDRYTGIKFGYNNGNTNHQKAAIQVRGTSGHVQPDMHFMLNTAPSEASVADADADRVFTLRNAGTQDHWGNRIVNSQTVSDLHRTAEPSLRFDGSTTTDPMVTVTAPNFPTGAAPRTMAGWVYFEDVSVDIPVFGYGDGVNSSGVRDTFEFYHYQSSGNSVGIRIHNAVDNSGGTTPITPNVWMHIAATYDGTTLKVYYDGVLNHSQTVTLATVSAVARFGADSYSPTPGAFFKGEIKDVRIHNRALDADEIAAAYNGESTPFEYASVGGTGGVPGVSNLTHTGWVGASATFAGTGWVTHSAADYSVASSGGHNNMPILTIISAAGANAYTYTYPNQDASGNAPAQTLIPGKKYRASIWVKSGTVDVAAYMHVYTAGWAGHAEPQHANVTSNSDWQEIVKVFTASGGGTDGIFFIKSLLTVTSSTQLWSDPKIEALGEVAAYTPQSINDKWYDTTSNANHGTITGATSVNRQTNHQGQDVDHLGPLIIDEGDTGANRSLLKLNFDVSTLNKYAQIEFNNTDDTANPSEELAFLRCTGIGDYGSSLGLYTRPTGNASTATVERLRINGDGEVQATSATSSNLRPVARVTTGTLTFDDTTANIAFRVTHNLGTPKPIVQVWETSGNRGMVETEVRIGDWTNSADAAALTTLQSSTLTNYVTIVFSSHQGDLTTFDYCVTG